MPQVFCLCVARFCAFSILVLIQIQEGSPMCKQAGKIAQLPGAISPNSFCCALHEEALMCSHSRCCSCCLCRCCPQSIHLPCGVQLHDTQIEILQSSSKRGPLSQLFRVEALATTVRHKHGEKRWIFSVLLLRLNHSS